MSLFPKKKRNVRRNGKNTRSGDYSGTSFPNVEFVVVENEMGLKFYEKILKKFYFHSFSFAPILRVA